MSSREHSSSTQSRGNLMRPVSLDMAAFTTYLHRSHPRLVTGGPMHGMARFTPRGVEMGAWVLGMIEGEWSGSKYPAHANNPGKAKALHQDNLPTCKHAARQGTTRDSSRRGQLRDQPACSHLYSAGGAAEKGLAGQHQLRKVVQAGLHTEHLDGALRLLPRGADLRPASQRSTQHAAQGNQDKKQSNQLAQGGGRGMGCCKQHHSRIPG